MDHKTIHNLKNTLVGFLVSFIGSIPFGYLNVVGYKVYLKFGINETIWYLLGVISIEFFVIFFTLIFANKLISNQKLLRFIEGFSVIFMFALAYVFYSSSISETINQSALEKYIKYSPYVVGIILSCFNFIQIPFWLSWNLYLLNGKYIKISKTRKYFYVFGTILGTFAGMLTFILFLNFITHETNFISKYLMKVLIPLTFIGMGIFQSFKFYKKYSK